jgi:hypothetical protein
MGVSVICVRRHVATSCCQFRVRTNLVQCEICAVQYELFYFGVNKFISGVNPSNQWYESSESDCELYFFWCEQYSFAMSDVHSGGPGEEGKCGG